MFFKYNFVSIDSSNTILGILSHEILFLNFYFKMVIIKKFDKRLLMCKFTNSHKFQLYIAATEKLCYELKVKIKIAEN